MLGRDIYTARIKEPSYYIYKLQVLKLLYFQFARNNLRVVNAEIQVFDLYGRITYFLQVSMQVILAIDTF